MGVTTRSRGGVPRGVVLAASARKWELKVGELAVYPGHGVARVEAARIWKILKERKRTKARSGIAWSRQFRELQDKLKVGTIFETAEVLRDLLRLQHTKELSFGERKLLENARSLLVQELAAAEKTGADEIEASIRAAVK